jgi:hypothetical protein
MFKKAVKHDAKLRMTINGPAGSGKTYTALLFASELGNKVAVVDTEHGSASKYADLWDFDVLELDSFHPQNYINAIHDAESAGYDVIVLDSLSHAWMGTDGLLDEVDKIAKRNRNPNTFAAWKDATPIQNKLIDTIIGARLHVVATMRTKQEYIIQEDEKGRKVPKMVGMAPVQRDGMEYEFDVVAEMDNENTMRIIKTRCPALSGGVYKKPGADVTGIIKAWLSGAGPAPEKEVQQEQQQGPQEPRLYASIETDKFRIPDDLDLSDDAKFEQALAMKVTFGKQHNGEALGDFYLDDKSYMRWLTEEFDANTPSKMNLKRAATFLRGRRKLEESRIPNEHAMPEGLGDE